MKIFRVEHKNWPEKPSRQVTLYNPPYDDETILSKTNWNVGDVTITEVKQYHGEE